MRNHGKPMKVVAPRLSVMAVGEWEFLTVKAPSSDDPAQEFALGEVTMLVTEHDDPGDMSEGEIIDFVGNVMRDRKLRHLVFIAHAHVVAANALEDPFFRADRYRTRVDEALSWSWELAQDIYEHNRQFQQIALPPLRSPGHHSRVLTLGGAQNQCSRPAALCSSGVHVPEWATPTWCKD